MDSTNLDSSTAVGHWGEVVNGGGERLAWEAARTLDAPLYVGTRNPDIEPEDVNVRDLFEDTVSGWLVDRGGLLRMLGQQAGWGTAHGLRDYDTLLTSGNECLAYVPREDQPWVHYVHHTSRYATDRLPAIEEKHQERFGAVKRRVEYGQRWMERQIYGRYSEKPTLLVANSEPVKRRIQTYWGIPSEDVRVVYPPVPTEEYSPSDADTGEYYVTVSRLDWHKNIDEIVEAFTELGDEYEVVVAGAGSEREHLESLAGENVRFEGYVSEDRKRELLAGARGFVFAAQSEDFGIAPVEALAAGTPVLGVEEGFTQHQILDGQNGRLWKREDGDLADTIREFDREGVAWSSRDIAEFARLNFGLQRFRQNLRGLIAEARDRHSLDINLQHPSRAESSNVEEAVATDGRGPRSGDTE